MTPAVTASGMIGMLGSDIGGVPVGVGLGPGAPPGAQALVLGATGYPFLSSATPGTLGAGHVGQVADAYQTPVEQMTPPLEVIWQQTPGGGGCVPRIDVRPTFP